MPSAHLFAITRKISAVAMVWGNCLLCGGEVTFQPWGRKAVGGGAPKLVLVPVQGMGYTSRLQPARA